MIEKIIDFYEFTWLIFKGLVTHGVHEYMEIFKSWSHTPMHTLISVCIFSSCDQPMPPFCRIQSASRGLNQFAR